MTQDNVDPAELAKFSSVAHNWWNTEGEFAPLHAINPLRLGWMDRIRPLAQQTVLDIGCGGGILAESMAAKGAQVMGIDLAELSIRVAKLHALEAGIQGLEYRVVSAEDLAAKRPASFDVVTCMEMLEHVPDFASVVRSAAQLVKPGGWVFFSTINRTPQAFLQAIVGAEYLLGMVPRGTHEYQRMIRPSELALQCRANGLVLRQTTGLTYNPLTQRYRLTSDTSVNYFLATQRTN